jgi:signal transduction histidine kinase
MRVAFSPVASARRANRADVSTGGGNGLTSVTKVSVDSTSTAGRGPETASAYEDARREDTIGRLRRATFLMLLPLTLALAVEVRVFGDTAPLRTLGLIGMLALATVTHVLVQQRSAGRRAIPIAIGFVGALAVLVLCTLAESPDDQRVQMGAVSALMMGAAILIPWGFLTQAIVAGVLVAGYLAIPSWSAAGAGLGDAIIPVIDCVGLSVVGAWVLDRQRRAIFAEREQARAALAQRELLLEANRALAQSLDFDVTSATASRAGRELLGSDTVALVVVDPRRGTLRTESVAGDLTDVDRQFLGLEVPTSAARPLLDALGEHGSLVLPDARFPGLSAWQRDSLGVVRCLSVRLARNDELFGYMNFCWRRGRPPLAPAEVRLAEGFAAKCALALAGARLVGDLQRANRVKTEFVSTMSHELRTPLNVMLGYTDVLADVVTDGEGVVAIERIRAAGRELLELIEATLDLNRLESGKDVARLEPVRMPELWDELAAEFAALPRASGVVLRWEPQGLTVAHTDRRKLRIIVKNLVGNALKFTAEGEVAASVRAQGGRCLVVVRDTGIGIPAEHLHGIFDMFHQVDSSDRRAFGGVGLGLYIVRRLADQLGATIDVASTVGKGTTFTVSLPLARAARVAA